VYLLYLIYFFLAIKFIIYYLSQTPATNFALSSKSCFSSSAILASALARCNSSARILASSLNLLISTSDLLLSDSASAALSCSSVNLVFKRRNSASDWDKFELSEVPFFCKSPNCFLALRWSASARRLAFSSLLILALRAVRRALVSSNSANALRPALSALPRAIRSSSSWSRKSLFSRSNPRLDSSKASLAEISRSKAFLRSVIAVLLETR